MDVRPGMEFLGVKDVGTYARAAKLDTTGLLIFPTNPLGSSVTFRHSLITLLF